MGRRVLQTGLLTAVFFGLFFFVVAASTCDAQQWSRRGKSNVFVFARTLSSDTTSGLGMTLEMDSTTVYGIGAEFDFSDRFGIGLDLYGGNTDFTATAPGVADTADTNIVGYEMSLNFNALKTRLTPMATATLGWINSDGDWSSGFGFSETDLTYGLGAGLRWDVADHFLIKVLYRSTWTKLEDSDSSLRLDGVEASVGLSF
jgi:opacity protein-like surface antigen